MSVTQPLGQEVIRTSLYTVLYTKYCQTMEENTNRENIIMRIWKDYTIEDPIIVIEKVIKPETINSYWRKPHPDVVHDFTGFTTEPVKEIMIEFVDVAKQNRRTNNTGE